MRPPVTMSDADGVWIGRDLYCLRAEGLRWGLTGLRELGYRVMSHRNHRNPATVKFETRDTPLWSAELPNVWLAQCLSCGGVIDPTDLHIPVRVCEFCGVSTSSVASVARENYRRIVFWRGSIFTNPQQLPFPSFVEVFEAWRWQRYQPGKRLADRLLRIGGLNDLHTWYRPGDVIEDTGCRLDHMGLFIKHLTVFDFGHWERAIAPLRRPVEPPLVVAAVRGFCAA